MGKLLSYNELKNRPVSKIFEQEEIVYLSQLEINEAENIYHDIVSKIEKGEDLDEGFLSGLLGGAAGALVGPAIGRAICKSLGIDEKGTLGKLLTSRLVTTSIGIALGK